VGGFFFPSAWGATAGPGYGINVPPDEIWPGRRRAALNGRDKPGSVDPSPETASRRGAGSDDHPRSTDRQSRFHAEYCPRLSDASLRWAAALPARGERCCSIWQLLQMLFDPTAVNGLPWPTPPQRGAQHSSADLRSSGVRVGTITTSAGSGSSVLPRIRAPVIHARAPSRPDAPRRAICTPGSLPAAARRAYCGARKMSQQWVVLNGTRSRQASHSGVDRCGSTAAPARQRGGAASPGGVAPSSAGRPATLPS
jgi:hypothetical protein